MCTDWGPATEIKKPPPLEILSPEQILLGPHVSPLDRIKNYSEDEFEAFIQEWAFFYLQEVSKKYFQINRVGGSGDLGRDVVCFVTKPAPDAVCDVFQCKRYDHPLYPSDLWLELAKLCCHTNQKKIPIPREYRFVAPQDVGPEADRILANPQMLRDGLIANWDKISSRIAAGKKIPLSGSMRPYVETFPFQIVGYKPILEVISEHERTRRYAPRFGGGLRARLPADQVPPSDIQQHEARYVQQLLEAYGDHAANKNFAMTDLPTNPDFLRHFDRSRERFYCAEILREFARDNLPEDVTFEQVQEQIYDAVVDVAEAAHSTGLERVNATVSASTGVLITNHPLGVYVKSRSRQGMCHQLANSDKLRWVR